MNSLKGLLSSLIHPTWFLLHFSDLCLGVLCTHFKFLDSKLSTTGFKSGTWSRLRGQFSFKQKIKIYKLIDKVSAIFFAGQTSNSLFSIFQSSLFIKESGPSYLFLWNEFALRLHIEGKKKLFWHFANWKPLVNMLTLHDSLQIIVISFFFTEVTSFLNVTLVVSNRRHG